MNELDIGGPMALLGPAEMGAGDRGGKSVREVFPCK